MKTIFISLVALVLFVGIQVWAADRDGKVNRAAAAYEACVQGEYHMTPIQWYELHNKYPLCGN